MTWVMFYDYFSLFLLFFIFLSLFYTMIALANVPYDIARKRNHPQQDAILIAGWFSLFTLHSMWAFLWIWASLYREDRGWGFQTANSVSQSEAKSLRTQIAQLQSRFDTLDQTETTRKGDK